MFSNKYKSLIFFDKIYAHLCEKDLNSVLPFLDVCFKTSNKTLLFQIHRKKIRVYKAPCRKHKIVKIGIA